MGALPPPRPMPPVINDPRRPPMPMYGHPSAPPVGAGVSGGNPMPGGIYGALPPQPSPQPGGWMSSPMTSTTMPPQVGGYPGGPQPQMGQLLQRYYQTHPQPAPQGGRFPPGALPPPRSMPIANDPRRVPAMYAMGTRG